MLNEIRVSKHYTRKKFNEEKEMLKTSSQNLEIKSSVSQTVKVSREVTPMDQLKDRVAGLED